MLTECVSCGRTYQESSIVYAANREDGLTDICSDCLRKGYETSQNSKPIFNSFWARVAAFMLTMFIIFVCIWAVGKLYSFALPDK